VGVSRDRVKELTEKTVEEWWLFLAAWTVVVVAGAFFVTQAWTGLGWEKLPWWRVAYGAASVWVVVMVFRFGISPWSRFGPPPELSGEAPRQAEKKPGTKEPAPPGKE